VSKRHPSAMMTGHWCAYAAAAVAARLRRIADVELAQAMAIAGALRPVVLAPGASVNPNGIKEGIPWATFVGIAAADAARTGMTGPLAMLDGLDRDVSLGGLGERWLIEEVYRKPYACCQWFHAALDALLALIDAHGLLPQEIESIRVATFANLLIMDNTVAPESIEAAEYSLPFCLAVAAIVGEAGLLPITDELLARPDVTALAERVAIVEDEKFERSFPDARRARVTVVSARGTYERQVDASRGVPENPMGESDLVRKLNLLTRRTSADGPRERLIGALGADDLAAGTLGPVLRESLLG